MIVTVLYFAQARERVGRASEAIELEPGARLEEAIEAIRNAHRELDPHWNHLAIAVDGVLAPPDAILHDGAEIALLPPVSGG